MYRRSAKWKFNFCPFWVVRLYKHNIEEWTHSLQAPIGCHRFNWTGSRASFSIQIGPVREIRSDQGLLLGKICAKSSGHWSAVIHNSSFLVQVLQKCLVSMSTQYACTILLKYGLTAKLVRYADALCALYLLWTNPLLCIAGSFVRDANKTLDILERYTVVFSATAKTSHTKGNSYPFIAERNRTYAHQKFFVQNRRTLTRVERKGRNWKYKVSFFFILWHLISDLFTKASLGSQFPNFFMLR